MERKTQKQKQSSSVWAECSASDVFNSTVVSRMTTADKSTQFRTYHVQCVLHSPFPLSFACCSLSLEFNHNHFEYVLSMSSIQKANSRKFTSHSIKVILSCFRFHLWIDVCSFVVVHWTQRKRLNWFEILTLALYEKKLKLFGVTLSFCDVITNNIECPRFLWVHFFFQLSFSLRLFN